MPRGPEFPPGTKKPMTPEDGDHAADTLRAVVGPVETRRETAERILRNEYSPHSAEHEQATQPENNEDVGQTEHILAEPEFKKQDTHFMKKRDEAIARRRRAAEAKASADPEEVKQHAEETDQSQSVRMETYQGKRQVLKETIAELMKESRGNTAEAKSAYFDSLKEYQKNRSSIGIIAEKFGGEMMSREVAARRKEWIRARAAEFDSQYSSVDERLDSRPLPKDTPLEELKNYKGLGSIRAEDIKKRYERRVMSKSILGAEEEEQRVRMEGLDSRSKGSIEKLSSWLEKQPKAAKILGTSALFMGGGIALAGGSVVAPIALIMGGTSAVLRWRAAAEQSKDPAVAKDLKKLATILSAAGIVGLATSSAVKGIHKLKGTKQKADELLAKNENFGDLGDVKNLEKLSKARKEALNTDKNIERQSFLASTIASIAGGALFGHSLDHAATASDLGANFDNPNTFDPMTGIETPQAENVGFPGLHEIDPSSGYPGTSNIHELGVQGTGHEIPAAAQDHPLSVGHKVTSTPEAVSTPVSHSVVEVKIEGKVNDADKLFGRFVHKLHEQYPDASKAPQSVQKLFAIDGKQDHLTTALGLQGDHGDSIVMHKGDYVSVNEDKIILHQGGKNPIEIIGSNGDVHHHMNLRDIRSQSGNDIIVNENTPITETQHTEGPLENDANNATDIHTDNPVQIAPLATKELHESQFHSSGDYTEAPSIQNYSYEKMSLNPNSTINYDLLTNAPKIGDVPLETHAFAYSTAEGNTQEVLLSPSDAELTNSHGLHIKPDESHVYALRNAKNTFIAYGNSEDKRMQFAMEFLNDPKNFQKVIIVPGDQVSSITHQPQSMLFTTDESGNIIHAANNVSNGGKVLPPPGIDAFVSIVK